MDTRHRRPMDNAQSKHPRRFQQKAAQVAAKSHRRERNERLPAFHRARPDASACTIRDDDARPLEQPSGRVGQFRRGEIFYGEPFRRGVGQLSLKSGGEGRPKIGLARPPRGQGRPRLDCMTPASRSWASNGVGGTDFRPNPSLVRPWVCVFGGVALSRTSSMGVDQPEGGRARKRALRTRVWRMFRFSGAD